MLTLEHQLTKIKTAASESREDAEQRFSQLAKRYAAGKPERGDTAAAIRKLLTELGIGPDALEAVVSQLGVSTARRAAASASCLIRAEERSAQTGQALQAARHKQVLAVADAKLGIASATEYARRADVRAEQLRAQADVIIAGCDDARLVDAFEAAHTDWQSAAGALAKIDAARGGYGRVFNGCWEDASPSNVDCSPGTVKAVRAELARSRVAVDDAWREVLAHQPAVQIPARKKA